MDKDLLNLIVNSINNDYFKMLCIDIIEDIPTNKDIIYGNKISIFTYLLINNNYYFLQKLFEDYTVKKNLFHNDLDYIYYKYLQANNLPIEEKIQTKLFPKSERYVKKLQKDINELESINIARYSAVSLYRKKNNYSSDLNKYTLFENSLEIISKCIKYKLQIANLNLQDNPKIDVIMKKYIKITQKLHTVENKSYLL